ncbi:hypothetical protein CC85DRAFT_285353 [Cutaneotrichosporon oleaginosum]|uniref:Uncharacterized protein n=1 Tax=Cutaneotrichosporon oleaginosum TaxID=879819 RepID=A0A0J0XNH4_9TREE|nr:uncharacterized protein CC85DRAFT_285353 [Cutaneotrichosporon oleaginosum]KLT42628.1 hypothetical protein CC85DRAFT_285353 [Cutaneotrichosporon oleaginosum]TXT05255.1 hypothetical protein COLE_06575 [Cutaneotrichosporon oleaginosum]
MGPFKRDPDGPPGYQEGSGGYLPEKKDPYSVSMGAGPTAGPSQPLFACLHLSREDRLRLLGFPPHITEVIKNTLAIAWPVGLQSSDGGPGWFEFKLRGYPWSAQGREAVPSKRLMIHLLHHLSNAGWHLAASTDLSKKSWDKDSLMFRAGPPVHRIIFAVTFNETDKIRIIDPPNDSIQQGFIQTVTRCWSAGIQDQKMKEERCYQMKLRGNPWYASSSQQVNDARYLGLGLLSTFDAMGYELLGCIDMNTGMSEDNRDMDAWFFAAKIV